MNNAIKKDILDIISKNPKYYRAKIREKYKDLLEELFPGKPLKEQAYLYCHDTPECLICGSKDLYFLNIKDGYSSTCSRKCAYQYRELYGKGNPAKDPELHAKGVETFKNKSIDEKIIMIEKRRATCLQKYGADNYTKTDDYNLKTKETSLLKYNTESPNQAESVKLKQKESCLKNLGVDNPSKAQEIKDKKIETCLEHYGTEYPAQSELVQQNRKEKTRKAIGVGHHMQANWSDAAKEILLDSSKLEEKLKIFTPIELSRQLKVAFSTVYNYAVNYGIRERYIDFSTENIVKNILEEFSIPYIKNDRVQIAPKELDFFLPDYGIAIEVCGLYWHSELSGKTKNYHLDKLRLCENRKIRLITIFEDELEDIDKIRNRLSHIMGKNKLLAYARNCTVSEISSKEARIFFNTHHSQNHIAAKVYLGAYLDNELVAAMSFGNLRRSLGSRATDNQYELLRYCSSGNIPGIASKLFKFFIKNHAPEKIISYCDRRWGTGDLYRNLGFELIKETEPNYWYLMGHNSRKHRFGFRKQKIVEMGGKPELSEWENMQIFGYDRIWDCGSYKFEWLA